MNAIFEKILSLAGMVFTTTSSVNRVQKQALDEFTVFVKDQLSYLMEQVKSFQTDYIAVSEKINEMYAQMRTLNEQLTESAKLVCYQSACAERNNSKEVTKLLEPTC